MHKGNIILKRENKDYIAGYCITQQTLPFLIESLSQLHPDEKNYYDTLQYDRRKKSYLLGRYTAKNAVAQLSKEDDLKSILIEFGVFHFPVVKSTAQQNIQVSISHCEDIGVALAFPEEHPMGIDIEKVDQQKINAIKNQVCANEFGLISSCNLPLEIGCTIIWTVKESLSKIFRAGLMMDFKMIEIKSIKKIGPVYVSTFSHYAQYKAISYCIGDYICSIVLPKNTEASLDDFWDNLKITVLK